jgi:hypothetical protein
MPELTWGNNRKREQHQQTPVAIYYEEDVITQPPFGFQPSLHHRIREVLQRQGIRTDVWIDPRPRHEQAAAWQPLKEAADSRHIQGIIIPIADWPHIAWISRLAVSWPGESNPDGTPHESAQTLPRFAAEAARQGLVTDPAWLVAAPGPLHTPNAPAAAEFSATELAEALVEQLRKQWRGEPVERIRVRPTLRRARDARAPNACSAV